MSKSPKPISFEDLSYKVGDYFSPSAPINSDQLFAGRIEQIFELINVYSERGKHAIIYGDRGVGKTSLANILHTRIKAQTWYKESVSSDDTFASMWRRVLSRISVDKSEKRVGFLERSDDSSVSLDSYLPNKDRDVTVNHVVDVIKVLSRPWLFIFDEFDRLRCQQSIRMMSDLVKVLSDGALLSTIVLVGVAEDISQLLEDHPSIERNIRQIKLQAMNMDELRQILTNAWQKLEMKGTVAVANDICHLSQGYPHFTHLLGMNATHEAIRRQSRVVEPPDLEKALVFAVEGAEQSIRLQYSGAIASSKSDAGFARTLLACALAKTDDLGYFRASDVQDAFQEHLQVNIRMQAFNRHLGGFCQIERAKILSRAGTTHRHRYKFSSALMRPYILMKGYSEGVVTKNTVKVVISQ